MTIQERLAHFLGQTPNVAEALWVAPNATLVGAVTLGAETSVFYGAVLRADIARIVVGRASNIQDNVVVHLADNHDVVIGALCTIGHSAIVHACTIEDECVIGMGSTILDGAVIGARSIVAAGSVVTPGTIVPPGSMVMGTPAHVMRPLTSHEQDGVKLWAEKYLHVARAHAARGQAAKPAANDTADLARFKT